MHFNKKGQERDRRDKGDRQKLQDAQRRTTRKGDTKTDTVRSRNRKARKQRQRGQTGKKKETRICKHMYMYIQRGETEAEAGRHKETN